MTELLSSDVLNKIKSFGVASISFSLDGASKETYDSIRRREGAFDRTVDAIRKVVDIALKIQVNTAVMGNNFLELPGIFRLIKALGVKTWELFFLIKVGRGIEVEDSIAINSSVVATQDSEEYKVLAQSA